MQATTLFDAEPIEVKPEGLTPADAAALYMWAIDGGTRTPPADGEEFAAVGRALRFLVTFAGDELSSEPIELGDLDPSAARNPVAEFVAEMGLPERCKCGADWFKIEGAMSYSEDDPRPVELTCSEGHPFRAMPGELSDPDEKALGPFVRDSETSRQAALAAYPRQGSQRWTILQYLFDREEEGRPGCTREELAKDLGMSPDSVRPRCVELRRGGWICAVASGCGVADTDETRTTEHGNEAEVLVLTAAAVERLQRG